MYEIKIKKKVDRFIDSLENSGIIRDKLLDLKYFKSRKIRLDIERVKGKKENLYRLRVGSLRFVFEVMKSRIIVKSGDYRGNVYS
tara:strand:+ start:737 stop:991 length:255 start_codon:yes stop_codon:yes gene_type:complete